MKVAGVFFNEPTKKHYLKEISNKCGLAHTSVKTYIDILIESGVIKENIEKRGKRLFPLYSASMRNESYKKYKKISNIKKILESGIIEHIEEKAMPNSIILFGSFLRGEDIEDSDIDLFVESNDQKINTQKFEKKLYRKIQLHFKQDINDYPNELKNNIINGFVLFGSLEVFK